MLDTARKLLFSNSRSALSLLRVHVRRSDSNLQDQATFGTPVPASSDCGKQASVRREHCMAASNRCFPRCVWLLSLSDLAISIDFCRAAVTQLHLRTIVTVPF